MGVVFALLLVLAVSCVGLDTARNRRPGASLAQVITEVGRRPTDWQLVAAGLAFVGTAFATTVTPWAALGGLLVLAFLSRFLHSSRPHRVPVPMPQQVLATPEPASNVKVL